MCPRRCNERGFTLLEVMIALAIVAIALVSLLGLSNRSILVQERVQKLTRATLLAQQLMSEEELLPAAGRDWAPKEEQFAAPDDGFRWQVSYHDTLIDKVKEVQVRVIWGEIGQNELVQLVSFVPAEGGR